MEWNYLGAKSQKCSSFFNRKETLIQCRMRQKEGKFFLLVYCTPKWTTECRRMEKHWTTTIDENRGKKDEAGQYLGAGSKYRTIIHDRVKRRREAITRGYKNYQYITNGNTVLYKKNEIQTKLLTPITCILFGYQTN